jgi:outer membrane protein assembly factor BamB
MSPSFAPPLPRFVACLVTLLWLSTVSAADPVEGRWLGRVGSDRERVEVGLEFLRDAKGTLRLRLTQPVSNYYGADPGGDVHRDGDRISHEGLALSLTLRDGALVGHYPGPDSPARFERVETLPQPAPLPAVPTGPGPRWEIRLGGQIHASPVVRDGIAYVGTSGGTVNAVDARDGRLRWTQGVGRPLYGDALVTDDAVYVASDGFLHKLARADGRPVWRADLGDAAVPRVLPHPALFDWDWQAPAPVLADGVVYIGAGDGGFHAIDAATGERRWRFEAAGKIRNGAAIHGTKVIFGAAGGKVHALDRRTGKPEWVFDTGADIDARPVVHAGRVLVGNRGGGLYSLDAATGAQAWRLYFWGSWVEATPVVVDGVIYIGSSDLRRVSAIDPASGRVFWRTDVHGWTWGTPLVVGDRIYVGVAGGKPYFIDHAASFSVLDRRSGALLRRWPLADSGAHQWGIAGSPAAAGDTVVVSTLEGRLLGFPLD